MKSFKFLSIFSLWLVSQTSSNCVQNKRWALDSPDQKIKVDIWLENGTLFYTISQIRQTIPKVILHKSPLGLVRQDGDFSTGLTFTGFVQEQEIDEKYILMTGKQRDLQNLCKEIKLEFRNQQQAKVQLVFRAYSEGVAFRYLFPEEEKKDLTVVNEVTGFQFSDGKAWLQPYDDVTKWTPAYEAHYMNGIPIGTPSPKINGWCFPALFHSNDTWILLTEAGEQDGFYGAHLQPESKGGLYTLRLPEQEEAMGLYPAHASTKKLPWSTPWRIVIVGNDLNAIVKSNIVTHVNPPNQLTDISWVKPGRASWSWLSDQNSPKDYYKLKSFVDLAAEMQWEYSLVDANWHAMKNGDIQKLVTYAATKNVGILLWYNSGGPHNEVEEMVRDIIHIPEKRKAEFSKLKEMGIKGVKIDFFQSDKPEIMNLYTSILKDAAHYSLMVNFHGCTIPRGWSRTYPNLMTMESVRGAECYTFASSYPELAPASNTILPLTRNVIGSMDYTPVVFSSMKMPHRTTNAHELALSVVFESGWVHFADQVSAYQSLPETPKNFLKHIPTVWDEIQFLNGYPGKEIVLARRRGDVWYVAGINGENIPKKLQIPFHFLNRIHYTAEVIADGLNSASFTTKTLSITNQSVEEIEVAPFGGFVIKLVLSR